MLSTNGVLERLFQKLHEMEQQYRELSTRLVDIKQEDFKDVSKQMSVLQPVIQLFLEYKKLCTQEEECLILAKSDELEMLIKEELERISSAKEALIEQMEPLVFKKNQLDHRHVFLEIRAATGGAESSLFVGELVKMYVQFAQQSCWNIEIIHSQTAEYGGYREIVFYIKGKQVYQHLQWESGVHRVQRIPKTESKGRIHTSTCTVAVLPETKEEEMNIISSDLRIDTFRASGAGGQHVQKTDSAIRIVHLPTGITAECQDDRSQHQNKARAMALLITRIQEKKNKEKKMSEDDARKNMIGSGERAEKIRTYNYPQNRITDHRIPITLHQLEQILAGRLDILLSHLHSLHHRPDAV